MSKQPARFGDFEIYPVGDGWTARHNLEESSTSRHFGSRTKAVGHAFKKIQPGKRILIFEEAPEYEDQAPDQVIRKAAR